MLLASIEVTSLLTFHELEVFLTALHVVAVLISACPRGEFFIRHYISQNVLSVTYSLPKSNF